METKVRKLFGIFFRLAIFLEQSSEIFINTSHNTTQQNLACIVKTTAL